MVAPQDLRKALYRGLLLVAPLLVALAIYIAFDPFKVVWSYDFANYYDQAAPVELNRDYVSLEMFLKNNPREQFDSFIFGSSRSFPLHCDTWQKSAGVPMRPFHYPAASENLHGVLLKLQYLSANGVPLSHVMIEASQAALGDVSVRRDHMHRLPRRLTGESWLDFQGGFLSSYLHGLFFLKYTEYKLTGRVRPSARDMLGIEVGMVRIDPVTNDFFFEAEERDLLASEDAFYAKRARLFQRSTDGPPPCHAAVVGPAQRQHLEAIREVLQKHRTKLRFVLPPVFDQKCIHRDDVAALGQIFGAENVFDFSGVNEWTEDMRSFYDPEHVRRFVGDKMIASMYR